MPAGARQAQVSAARRFDPRIALRCTVARAWRFDPVG